MECYVDPLSASSGLRQRNGAVRRAIVLFVKALACGAIVNSPEMNQESFLKAAAAYAAAAAAERDGASEQGKASELSSSSILDEEDQESSASDGNWESSGFGNSTKDQPVRPSFQSQNSWARQSMTRVSIVNVSRAARSELSNVVAGSDATVDTGVHVSPTSSDKSTPLRPVQASSTQDVTLRQKAMAAFRNHWLMAVFVAVFVGLIVLTWFGIRSIYIDPAILTGRFLAATVIVCFSVFLFPFVRVVQGQMYDKLADFASFFNPHLHKALGVLLIAAGSFHGVLWNIATLRSCEGTWCPVQRQGYDDPLVHASCIRTFCHDNNVPFDAYARGSLPSFSAAFSANVPLNLEQSQAAVRSFYYGYICMMLFVTIGIFTLPRIRRENFELFYYSHHLFILAIPVLFLHCWTVGTPSFPIQVMLIPCGIATIFYGFDKLVSVFFRRHTSEKVDTIFYSDGRILELRFRPVPAWPKLTNPSLWFSNSNLILDAPVRCAFAPGMNCILHKILWHDAFAGAYIDINCPAVSKFQWHPFTVISHPFFFLRHSSRNIERSCGAVLFSYKFLSDFLFSRCRLRLRHYAGDHPPRLICILKNRRNNHSSSSDSAGGLDRASRKRLYETSR